MKQSARQLAHVAPRRMRVDFLNDSGDRAAAADGDPQVVNDDAVESRPASPKFPQDSSHLERQPRLPAPMAGPTRCGGRHHERRLQEMFAAVLALGRFTRSLTRAQKPPGSGKGLACPRRRSVGKLAIYDLSAKPAA
jgi:hypothetical protein